MIMSEMKDLILATAPLLMTERIINTSGIMSVRFENTVIIPLEGLDLSKISAADLVEVNINSGDCKGGLKPAKEIERHLAVYKARPDINALIHSTTPSVICCSKSGEVVKPLLDDMAQIVGTSLRTAPRALDVSSLKSVVKGLNKRNAVFIDGEGALCGASTMDDAHAICQVSEKACQAWVESAVLGGGHVINEVESWLMRTVYLKKYSKQAERNK